MAIDKGETKKKALVTSLHDPAALRGARQFALVKNSPSSTQARVSSFGRHSVRPNHLPGHNCDHDYHFELPLTREGGSNPDGGDLLHTLYVVGLFRMPTEFHSLLIIPFRGRHRVWRD